MESLIKPVPLPDELDRGYLGRVMRINGFVSEKETKERLASGSGLTHLGNKELSFLELLSKVVDQSTEQFALAHSTLPLRRAITSYLPELAHGSTQRRSILCLSGMAATQSGAYLCRQCVSEDIGFHGVAYWRREHQIPGQLWCPKHGIPLNYLREDTVFAEPPTGFVQGSETVPRQWVDESRQNVYVQRFLDIASGLLVHNHPVDAKFASLALKQRAVATGLQANAKGIRRPLLSDLIVECFPKSWLSAVFHALIQKKRGEIQHQVDGVLYLRNAASSVVVYVLACAVLYESPEAALNALFNATHNFAERPARVILTKSSIGRKQITDAYVQCMGKVTPIAKLLEIPTHQVTSLLAAHGLPSMSSRSHSRAAMLAACRTFYIERKSLKESAATHDIPMQDLEDVIRASGEAFTNALQSFQHARGRPKADRTRLKGVMPKSTALTDPAAFSVSTVTSESSYEPRHHILETETQN